MRVRKWYFASNVHGLRNAFDQIMAAVLSCRAKTDLSAHCLIDDEGADAEVEARIRWLVEKGVDVRRHKASMVAILQPQFPDGMKVFGGHWLRCDIPDLERDEEFVLYTDIDVVFLKNLPEVEPPAFVSCGPEHHRDDESYFNSGVMIINIPAMRARKAELVEVVRRRLKHTAPYDDQSALNELLADKWLKLSPLWNWKPYWGENPDAIILHFHGPKPRHVAVMQGGSVHAFGTDYRVIFERNKEGYRHYVGVFDAVLAPDATSNALLGG